MSTTTAPTVRPPQLASVPEGDVRDRGGPSQPMLIVSDLKKHFAIKGGVLNRAQGHVRAVDGISFTVLKGETLASSASPAAASPRWRAS